MVPVGLGVGLGLTADFATAIFEVLHAVFPEVLPVIARFAPVAHIFKVYLVTFAVLETVPLNFPVEVASFNPDGRVPAIFHMYGGPFPPATLAANEYEYALPCTALGS